MCLIGYGFLENHTQVDIGGTSCEIEEIFYNNITCKTPSGNDGSTQVSVKYVKSLSFYLWRISFSFLSSCNINCSVQVESVGNLPAICTGICEFTYSLSETPILTSVTPTSVGTQDQSLLFEGVGFSAISGDNTITLGLIF